MAQATATQIQQYCNERVRVRAEQIRALINALKDDKIAIDDVYAGLVGSQSGWTDSRTDGPPHLADANTILTYNTFTSALLAVLEGTSSAGDISNLPGAKTVVLTMCVRPI
jgi:hypothetical protein